MERNTKTTVYNLQPGDRFYKCSDRNKTVLEKVDHKTKQTSFQTYKHWFLHAAIADNKKLSDRAREAAAQAIKSDTEVIFLRHKGEK